MKETFVNIIYSPNFWGILIPACVGIFTFYKSKKSEREAEWRKEKLKLYLNFVESLSGITDAEKSDVGEIKFAKACNDLHAFSPNSVLKALHGYQDKIASSNKKSNPEEKQKALNRVMWEMRNDLKIRPSERKTEFEMLLWTSGKKRTENKNS